MGLLEPALWGGVAAFSLVLGAFLAFRFRPSTRTVGLVMGFGAGALISAIAYELLPDVEAFAAWDILAFALGTVAFFGADRAITRRGRASRTEDSAGESIALGALLDGIPESMVLGMGLAAGGAVSVSFLAAVFVSNLPESLGASAAMHDAGHREGEVYRLWWLIVVVSAVSAAFGYGIVELVPATTGRLVQAFAAGAVLTMLSNSMIPEAHKEGGSEVGLLTALGFAMAALLTALG